MTKRNTPIWGAIAGILIVFVATVGVLDHRGRQARIYAGPGYAPSEAALPVTVVETSDELFKLYTSKEVRGRILVHFGKYLHGVDIDAGGLIPPGGQYPVRIADLLPLYEKRVSYQNAYWVSMQANIVREIYYVEPPDIFRKRLKDVGYQDPDLISRSDHTIVLQEWGARRTISDQVPDLHEPVLVNVDASVFEELQPEQLLSALKASSLIADVITLNLSLDNPDVTESCRAELRLFAQILGGGRGQ